MILKCLITGKTGRQMDGCFKVWRGVLEWCPTCVKLGRIMEKRRFAAFLKGIPAGAAQA